MSHLNHSTSNCCADPATPVAPVETEAVSPALTVLSPEKIEETTEPTQSDGVVSFKVSRQAIMVAAFVLLAVISTLETVELWQLRRALTVWQKLPVIQSNITSAPSGNGGANSLPSQVGGC